MTAVNEGHQTSGNEHFLSEKQLERILDRSAIDETKFADDDAVALVNPSLINLIG